MSKASSPADSVPDPLASLLGYLNFSAGAVDAAAWRAVSDLFARFEPVADDGTIVERPETAAHVADLLRAELARLQQTDPAFRDVAQAVGVIRIVFDCLLPAYRQFHRDLLEHQPAGALERPFFIAAAMQAVLATGGPWEGADSEVADRSIRHLNDYMGWRPVAVLENGQLSEPYPHERVRPLPLYVDGAGAAHGRFARLVERAVAILYEAPADLLRQADFDPRLLNELAIDPRAFDFLHPAASRPNYLFGLWDPALIDDNGCYRRLVIQQATLEGILSWAEAPQAQAHRAEAAEESAAVLAGVMLMASGLSGHGPGAAQAGMSLAELLPRIAAYRDNFYRWLLTRLPSQHRQRLEAEAATLQQPFGGVRRHINILLADRRARQVGSVTLASVLARLGRAEAAERLAGLVPAASARMLARITSRIVAAQLAVRRDDVTALAAAHDTLDEGRNLLLRGIACGALVDPWNILGLAGQFPLHEPGGEALPDPRVDDLIGTVGNLLEAWCMVWQRACLEGAEEVAARAGEAVTEVAAWWDQFATTTVAGIPHLSGRDTLQSAREVIAVLEERRATAPAPLPAGFWREAVAEFSSARTHAAATEALLREGDFDAAMGLLVHWVSLLEGDEIDHSGSSWLLAAHRWLRAALADLSETGGHRVRRFLELVEANTAGVAELIELAATGRELSIPNEPDLAAADDSDDEQFSTDESVASAYESMVWQDSADDGTDGGMLDVDLPGGGGGHPVVAVEEAADFLTGVIMMLRQTVATGCLDAAAGRVTSTPAEIDSLLGWRQTLRRLRRAMVRAATHIVSRDQKPAPGMSPAEFDRLRWQRDAAAERLIEAALQTGETIWMLSARLALARGQVRPSARPEASEAGRQHLPKPAVGRLLAAVFVDDQVTIEQQLERIRRHLRGRTVLYVPLSRGGRPDRIIAARMRERLLERLVTMLPRRGRVEETIGLVRLAKSLESQRPPGAASVSEFDRVFEAATTALVGRIVASAPISDQDKPPPSSVVVTQRILDGLAILIPKLLETWTTHARQLRLSVLERVRDDKAFASIREFIERYGVGLFTQHLLTPPSLRGILRGGVRPFLEKLADQQNHEPDWRGGATDAAANQRNGYPGQLIEALASGELPMKQAASRLRLVLEAVAENHSEYRDWNSTTTQSDRGDYLYILLEFLRIKAEYERIAWTLRPVSMAHRVLVRSGAAEAATAWRERMQEETADAADELVTRLTTLQQQTGVRLASVADRVHRPFTAMLEQDELESLVEPAVRELVSGTATGAGTRLEDQAEHFLGIATGSGVEVPDWLDQLSGTVDRVLEEAETGGLPTTVERPLLPTNLAESLNWSRLPWSALLAAVSKKQGRS